MELSREANRRAINVNRFERFRWEEAKVPAVVYDVPKARKFLAQFEEEKLSTDFIKLVPAEELLFNPNIAINKCGEKIYPVDCSNDEDVEMVSVYEKDYSYGKR